MPLIIGLTGGIGSGKSEVSKRFTERDILIVDADIVAREVVEPNSLALKQISDHFGNDILNASGELNRSRLREIIFSKPSEKTWLESLLHPIINASIRQQLSNATSDYSILVSPLLLETKQFELVDRILVIDVDEQLQIERASQRDNNMPSQIKAIMQTQLSRQERCARADDIILNNGNIAALDEQVEKLHQLYLTFSENTLTDKPVNYL